MLTIFPTLDSTHLDFGHTSEMSTVKRMRNKTTMSNRSHLPLPTGRYKQVAFRDFLVGHSRKASVLVRLFYPQQTAEGENHDPLLWREWLPHPAYKQGLIEMANLKSRCLISLMQRLNKLNALVPAIPNGPPAKGNGKYPAIVFSHGVGGFRNMSASLCIELASHGFVVAALEHRDNSACLAFYSRKHGSADGKSPVSWEAVESDDELDFGNDFPDSKSKSPLELEKPALNELELEWVRHRYVPVVLHNEQVYAFRNRQVHQRARDCSRAVDLLKAINDGSGFENLLDPSMNVQEFKGLIDMDKLIVTGHSFGGGTSILAAMIEPRFKVVVAFDPWMYPIGYESLTRLTQPVISINTEELVAYKMNMDKLVETMLVAEGEDPDRRQAWTLSGSSHMQQCDAPFVFNPMSFWMSGFEYRRTMRHLTAHNLTAMLALKFIGKWLDIKIDKNSLEYLDEKKHRMRSTFPDLNRAKSK